MIRYAYELRDYQLIDVPSWASTTGRRCVAQGIEGTGTPTVEQARRMLQTLLADWFGLRVHRETRQLPAYELRLARGDGTLGPQLAISDIDCEQAPQQTGRGGQPACQGFQNRSLISGRGRRLDVLAMALQTMLRQKVLNDTGLTGVYNFTMRWEGARGPAEEERRGYCRHDDRAGGTTRAQARIQPCSRGRRRGRCDASSNGELRRLSGRADTHDASRRVRRRRLALASSEARVGYRHAQDSRSGRRGVSGRHLRPRCGAVYAPGL